MPEAWWQQRTRRLESIFGSVNANLTLVNDRFTLVENDKWGNFIAHFEILETLIKQHRPHVVIVDPLSGYYDLSESSSDLNRKFMERLTGMAIRLGIAVVLVHHDRKSQSGEPMHSLRGSSAFTDWATSVFGLRIAMDEDAGGKHQVPSPTDLELTVEKARLANGPRPDAIRLKRINGSSYFETVEQDNYAINSPLGF
jgi:RecA-family ATPase